MDTGDAPSRAAEGLAPPRAAEFASIASAETIGSRAASSLRNSSPGSNDAKANTKAAVSTQKKAKRKGRPPKAKGAEALEWSEAMTASLMRLRYETFRAKFQSARNNALIRAAWLLLAREISKEHEVLISSEQCKNKIKGLKKKWAEYCSDISSTGNNVDKPIVEPVCLGLMEEYWTRFTEMQGDSLADNDNVGELFDSGSEDDHGSSGSRKRGKTVAEGLEVGMKAMSAGFHAVATAISSQQAPRLTVQPQPIEQFMEARFNIVIEQPRVQNQNLASLIEFLQ